MFAVASGSGIAQNDYFEPRSSSYSLPESHNRCPACSSTPTLKLNPMPTERSQPESLPFLNTPRFLQVQIFDFFRPESVPPKPWPRHAGFYQVSASFKKVYSGALLHLPTHSLCGSQRLVLPVLGEWPLRLRLLLAAGESPCVLMTRQRLVKRLALELVVLKEWCSVASCGGNAALCVDSAPQCSIATLS